ncbi:MAG: hypothetical protein ACWA5A_12485 [Marinibacterium sp.]
MTTWTFDAPVPLAGLTRRIVSWALICLVLIGCSQGPSAGADGHGSARKETSQAGKTRVLLGDGRVMLKAPAGYCIDPETLDAAGRQGFAMLARCDLVNGSDDRPLANLRAPALITVTTRPWSGDTDTVSVEQLAAAYPEESILDRRRAPAAALIRVDGGAPDLNGIDDIHWRGAMVVNGQIVTLGLFAPPGSSLLGASGGTLLAQMARRISRDSLTGGAGN